MAGVHLPAGAYGGTELASSVWNSSVSMGAEAFPGCSPQFPSFWGRRPQGGGEGGAAGLKGGEPVGGSQGLG